MPARVLDLLLFITAVGLPMAGGFAEGPPVEVFKSVCESMMPLGHCKAPSTGSQRRRREDINCAKDLKNRAVPSTAMSPYELVVPPCYKNSAINVQLRVSSSDKTYFKGMFVQARVTGTSNASHGEFTTGGDSQLKPLDCFSFKNNALSQSRALKYQCKTFLWQPPGNFSQSINFVATVIKHQDVYWTGLTSALIDFDANCEDTTLKCQASTSSNLQPFLLSCIFMLALCFSYNVVITH